MNLAQLVAQCHSKTNYSRSDGDVYAALDAAGFRVYSAVLKEFRGFFLKFDETSLTLDPTNATQEYTLPADFTQMVHLAERLSATENWRPMSPIGLDSAVSNLQQAVGWEDFYSTFYGYASEFGYYGPYLDASASKSAQSLQIQKIRVSPTPGEIHFCQLVYTAKWLPVTGPASTIMLPDEGTHAMLQFATAKLQRDNDDTRWQGSEADGLQMQTSFLNWCRLRQIQTPPVIKGYGPDSD